MLIAGCKTAPTINLSDLEQPKAAHPEWPRIPSSCNVPNYTIGTSGDGAVIMIPYQEYMDQRSCERNRMRYVSGLTGLACFYRQDLKEPRCEYYYPQAKEETK